MYIQRSKNIEAGIENRHSPLCSIFYRSSIWHTSPVQCISVDDGYRTYCIFATEAPFQPFSSIINPLLKGLKVLIFGSSKKNVILFILVSFVFLNVNAVNIINPADGSLVY